MKAAPNHAEKECKRCGEDKEKHRPVTSAVWKHLPPLHTGGWTQRFGWVSKCCGVLHDRSGTCFLLSGMKSMPTAESLLYICRLQTRSLLCCVCLSYAIREALWSLLKLKSKVWTCWHVRDVGRDIWKWGRDKWKEKRRKRWGWIEDQNQTSFMKESLSSCSAASLIRFSE